ncbi:MAG: copper resistance protein NlpE [Flavobacterium sp.]
MKGKKMLALAVLVTGIAFVGCKEEKKEETAAPTEQVATPEVETTPIADTSETSLDWAGTYEGTLPGANSDIKTTVVLNQDKTFAKTSIYVDKKAGEKFEEKGTFTWNAEGTIVTLKAEGGEAVQYKVQEGSLLQLDQEGKEITGDMAKLYELKKK